VKNYSHGISYSFVNPQVSPAFKQMVRDAAYAATMEVGDFCVRALTEAAAEYALPKSKTKPQHEPETVRSKGGRPRLNLTPEQMAERHERRIEQQRAYDARKRDAKLAAKASALAQAAHAGTNVVRKRGRQPLTPEQKAASRERQLAYWRETAQRRRAAKWAAYEKYAQMGAEA
jgi:hypothetical protein